MKKFILYSLLLFVVSLILYGFVDGLFYFLQVFASLTLVSFVFSLLIHLFKGNSKSLKTTILGMGVSAITSTVLLFSIYFDSDKALFLIMSVNFLFVAILMLILHRYL